MYYHAIKKIERLAYFKWFIAALLVLVYFFMPEWLMEVLLIAVIITLIAPWGWMDNFLELKINNETENLQKQINLLSSDLYK